MSSCLRAKSSKSVSYATSWRRHCFWSLTSSMDSDMSNLPATKGTSLRLICSNLWSSSLLGELLAVPLDSLSSISTLSCSLLSRLRFCFNETITSLRLEISAFSCCSYCSRSDFSCCRTNSASWALAYSASRSDLSSKSAVSASLVFDTSASRRILAS